MLITRDAHQVFQDSGNVAGPMPAETPPVPRDAYDRVVAAWAETTGLSPLVLELQMIGPHGQLVVLIALSGTSETRHPVLRDDLVIPAGWFLRAVTGGDARVAYLGYRFRLSGSPPRGGTPPAALTAA